MLTTIEIVEGLEAFRSEKLARAIYNGVADAVVVGGVKLLNSFAQKILVGHFLGNFYEEIWSGLFEEISHVAIGIVCHFLELRVGFEEAD